MEDASERRTRRTDEVPNIAAGSHFVRENIRFRSIPNAQTSPEYSSSTAATLLLGYLVTLRLGYFATLLLGYLATLLLGYLATWLLCYLATWHFQSYLAFLDFVTRSLQI